MVGSPPGLPGGGMTGVGCEPGGGGTCICGSTPRGGCITPFWRSSCWDGLGVAGGAWPSVSLRGCWSRSAAMPCAQPLVEATRAAKAAPAASERMVARVMFTSRLWHSSFRTPPGPNRFPPGGESARGRTLRHPHKVVIFQRLHNLVTLSYRLTGLVVAVVQSRRAALERARLGGRVPCPRAQRGFPPAELLSVVVMVVAGHDQGGVSR